MSTENPPDGGASPSARAAVAGLLHERKSTYLAEYAALVDAAFAVAERTGVVEPRVADIVSESGLSNQVFYRHFTSKDELLLAVLEDGRHRLVSYLESRAGRTTDPMAAIEAWIRGVLAQAQDPEAAARSRPFAVHGDRLDSRFPEARSESVSRLEALLRQPVEAAIANGSLPAEAEHRIDLVFWTAFNALKRNLVSATAPTTRELDDIVEFCLRGLGR